MRHLITTQPILTYYIHEGEPYKVSNVSITAPEELGLDTKKIIDDFRLEAGDTMNSARLRQDMKKLDDMVADKGLCICQSLSKD